MAKGYSQVEGFDFQKTFSLVANQTIVHVILALAASYSWSMMQLDINNAFLNGKLEEEVFMEVPQGYQLQGECETGYR